MTNDGVGNLLPGYLERYPSEREVVTRFDEFAAANSDAYLRTCVPGHFTGSAWVAAPDRKRFLLIHHRKLDRWMQPGGHADGDVDLAEVARREAMEETGVEGLELVSDTPLDLDIHVIPARGLEPQHLHYDVRFLFVASSREILVPNHELKAARWADAAEVSGLTEEESVLRLLRKAIGVFEK